MSNRPDLPTNASTREKDRQRQSIRRSQGRCLVILATEVVALGFAALEVQILDFFPFDGFSGLQLIDVDGHISVRSQLMAASNQAPNGTELSVATNTRSWPGSDPVVGISWYNSLVDDAITNREEPIF
jgi:hypothetical protein